MGQPAKKRERFLSLAKTGSGPEGQPFVLSVDSTSANALPQIFPELFD